jgi:phosphatidylserine/phosphatidylglycerophosphate/cardiolipin synthase-like enzyme
MPIKLGNIEMFFGPTELNQPDNLENIIIDFINGANDVLHIAVQELDNENIARAIIDAKKRKVEVVVVMEFDYLTVDKAPADPWQPFSGDEGNEPNRRIYTALLRAQVNVRTDINPKIFHQKFIVRDPDGAKAAVLTGSTNFTVTDTHKNLNHIVIIHGKKAVQVYEVEFAELETGNFGQFRSRFYPTPKEITVSDVRIRILFAPDHSPEMEIMKQMLKSKSQIDFAIFTFSKSSGIDDTMVALQKSGIKIKGIFDKGQGNHDWASTKILKSGNVDVYLADNPNLRKLHHKLMVIDKQTIIAGSFNYTDPANTLNDENIIIIGNSEETDSAAISNQKTLGTFTHDVIDKIITDFGVKVT